MLPPSHPRWWSLCAPVATPCMRQAGVCERATPRQLQQGAQMSVVAPRARSLPQRAYVHGHGPKHHGAIRLGECS